jgi:hypothetical protein
MIRPATLADANAIFEIALIEASKYPKLLTDKDKIRKRITAAISAAKHFAWVSTEDGRVNGALVGISSDNLWAQRSNCFIALWKSVVAGDGRKMMKEFLKWVDARRIIRVAGVVPDSDHFDPLVWKLLERLGFRKCGGAYLIYN